MTILQKYLAPLREGEGAGSGGAAAGSAGGTSGGAASGTPTPWYGDKIDELTRAFWQNKGIDPADPISVASKLTEMYRNAERHIGAPPEEMLRIPKPNAAEADIRAYWGKIGVPAEAKDYDLSAVKKFADGKELEPAFLDMFRAAAHAARIPKDQVSGMLDKIVKHMDGVDAAEAAEKTRYVTEQKDALKTNWGQNYDYNYAIAKRALDDLGKAARLTPEQTAQAWDALSTVGGIGSAFAMEMLRNIGSRMNTTPAGEAPFIDGRGPQGNNGIMSQAQARARIDELKTDKGFYKRLVTDREVAAKREWDDLHKIAFPRTAA